MLSERIADYYDRLGLSVEARELVDQVRTSRAFWGNMRGSPLLNFQSEKMRGVFQVSTDFAEFAAVHFAEANDAIKEYYFVRIPVHIAFPPPPPDESVDPSLLWWALFVLHQDWAGWMEVKTQMQMAWMASANPTVYDLDNGGNFHNEAGEDYVNGSGLTYYPVVTEANMSTTFTRSTSFLLTHVQKPEVLFSERPKGIFERLKIEVGRKQGIQMSILHVKGATRDHLHTLIARGEIIVPSDVELGHDSNYGRLYRDRETCLLQSQHSNRAKDLQTEQKFNKLVETGITVIWAGIHHDLLTCLSDEIVLREQKSGDLKGFLFDHFRNLLSSRHMTNILYDNRIRGSGKPQDAQTIARADLCVAVDRYSKLKPYLRPMSSKIDVTCSPTIRQWINWYLDAEQKLGNGLIGLLPTSRYPFIKNLSQHR